ncbi:MAG TPA: hypothetical protein VMU25_01370 [Candidatus Paceibacterota bacterium]|nr:hypothetical protein [Candidatus Paceibacterota bacterium]
MTKTAIAATALGVLLTGGAAFAQSTSQMPATGYPDTGYPANGTPSTGAGAPATDYGASTSNGMTGSSTMPGTMPAGTGAPTTGVPNTGAGGNAPETAALLAGAAAAALVGAVLIGRRKEA